MCVKCRRIDCIHNTTIIMGEGKCNRSEINIDSSGQCFNYMDYRQAGIDLEVVCLSNRESDFLTVGKTYKVYTVANGYYVIKNNRGRSELCDSKNFCKV